ncbi:hypothetical protein [Leisingera sp. M523]|uniref:hypothetical protein n=1 Tax=Leisingera sp. M523 TaxID=2867013 RepID=UPI0021A49694|nr:hypothetical protein [Leisingera sp. M523]UWQ29918.1 hypothetical protein K3557_05050 [Leisingera sp. M523]
MSAVIGALRGLLSLDSAAFDSGAKRAKASMGNLERSMVRMGGKIEAVGRKMTLGLTLPMAGAATVAVKSSLKVIDAQAKLAQSFGTTVKSVQVLERASDLAGVSMGETQQAAIQLSKRLSQVASGSGAGAASKALDRLHLSAQDLQRLPLDQRLAKIQAAMSSYVPEAERAAIASDLFGSRAGLIFTRIDGSALRIATEDVTRFGVAVSEVDADQIERTNDAISRLGLVGRGVSNQLAVGLAPTLEWLSDSAADAAEWFNGLSDRAKQFISVGAAFTATVGPAAIGLGLLLKVAVPLGGALLGTVAAVTLAPVKFIAAAKASVALEMALGATSTKAALASIGIKGLTGSLKVLRVAALATGIGALIGVSAGIYQSFVQSKEAAENYEVAIRGLASAHDVLNTATETFYSNMTAKNAEAMRRAAEAARDATRAALEAARAELEAASFTTNFFGASLYETDRMAKARADIEQLGAALAEAEARLDAAAVAAKRTAAETGNAAENAAEAANRSNDLAGGLAAASGQASALSSYLASVPSALASAQTNIAGLKAGMAVLSAGGDQAAANVAKYRAELEASAGPLGQMQDGQRAHVQETIEQQVQVYAHEQQLRAEYQLKISALNKVKSAGGAASKSALAALQKEIQERRELLGLTEGQRKKLEAIRLVQQRLGKEAQGMSKAQISGLADQVIALDRTEAATQRVADQQARWAENITRTAFGGGSLSDTIEGMLRDIAFQFANSKVVLPIIGHVTGFLGLDQLVSGSGGQQAASGLLGGGGGGGLLNLGGSLLGGGGSALAGIGSGLGGILSGGGLGASFANLGGLVTGASAGWGALGAALPALGLLAGGVAILAKGLSRKYRGSGFAGSFDGEGFTGTEFDFYKGGFLRSDKWVHKGVNAEIEATLDEAMQAQVASLQDLADTLGLSSKGIKRVKGEGFSVWTNDKTQEQIQEEFAQHMGVVSDEMAELILKGHDVALAGETATEALSRLAGGLMAVNDVMDLLNATGFETSLKGGQMASDLVDSFGGAEQMQAATTAYFAGFYSESEKAETLRRRALDQLRSGFGDLGIAMPKSREGFRDLVQSVDLTTASGRDLYAELVQLSAGMDQVLPKVGAYTEAMQGLVDKIGGELGMRIEAADDMAAASKAAAQLWYRSGDKIRDVLGGLVNSDLTAASSGQALAVQRNRFQSAFDLARGGNVQAAQDIPGLAQAYLQSLRSNAGSALDYRRAAAQVQGQLGFAAGIADLEGSNEDVLRGLYEQQIEVLTNLGQFLQLEGLTADQVGELSAGVQALTEDWDGTVAAFEASLGALGDAIKNAEAFSYDDLVGRLDVAVSLDDSAPNWLARLVDRADTGIRTTLDFVIRNDGLSPADKWIATNALSEHVASLDLVLREDLDAKTRRLVLRTSAGLRRDMTLNLVQDLDQDTRQMVLTRAASLSRRVNVALTKEGGHTLRKLNQLQDLIGSKGSGKITFNGEVSFEPAAAFSTLFGDVAASGRGLVNPMNKLTGMLGRLQAAVDKDRLQRETAQKIAGLQVKGADAVLRTQQGHGVVDKFNALRDQYNISLVGQRGTVGVNDAGRIVSSFDYYGGGDVVGFKKALRDQFGTDAIGKVFSASNASVGSAEAQIERLKERIRAMGAIPGFAAGGSHTGGWRVVGEKGWELENTGPSRVMSHSDSVAMLDNRHVVRSIDALNRNIDELMRQQAVLAQRQELYAKKTAQVLEGWDEAGQPGERV